MWEIGVAPCEPSKGDLRAVLRGISRALESSRGARDLAARSRLQGCAYEDPDHTWAGIAVQYADGRCDGFLQTAKVGDRFPIGYYREDELPILSALAKGYTTFYNAR